MERQSETVDKNTLPFVDKIAEQIWQHYRERPFRSHFGAWLIIGLVLGFLIAPNLQTTTLIAFSISGCIAAVLLAIFTYPISYSHRFTLTGAATGLFVAFAYAWISSTGRPNFYALQLGLMIGALIGATGMVWLGPIRVCLKLLRPAAKPVSASEVETANQIPSQKKAA